MVFALFIVLLSTSCLAVTEKPEFGAYEAEKIEVEEAFARVMIHADSPHFFQKVLGKVAEKLLSKPNVDRARGEALLARIKKRFPDVFFFTIADESNLPVTEWCDGIPPRVVLRKFLSAMTPFDKGNTQPLSQSWKLIKSFLGPNAKIQRISRESLFQVSFRKEKTWLYISKTFPGGTLICHLNHSEKWKTLGLRYAVSKWNSGKSNVKIGIADLRKGKIEYFEKHHPGIRRTWKALRELELNPISFLIKDDYLWGYRPIAPNLRLIASLQFPELREKSRGISKIICFLFSIPIFWCFFHFKEVLRKRIVNCSINQKLYVVYLSVTCVSILVLGFGGMKFLMERQGYLENSRFQAIERSIQVFDRRFPIMIGEMEKFFVEKFRIKVLDDGSAEKTVQNLLQGLTSQFPDVKVSFLDNKGKLIVPQNSTKGLWGVARVVSSKNIMARLIRTINNPDLNEVAILKQEIARTLVDEKLMVDDLISEIKSSFNVFIQSHFGPAGLEYHGNFPLYFSNGMCYGIIFLDFSDDQMQNSYVKKYLPSFSRQFDGAEVFAFHLQDRKRNWRIATNGLREVIPFFRRVSGSNSTLHEIIRRRGVPSILVGMKGLKLSRFSLMVRKSVADIPQKIGKIRQRLIFYGFGLLGVSLLISHLLGQHFLNPVKNLNQAIVALENRDFSYRVTIENPDELGNLAAAFNEMTVDMEDLEVAKVVQDTLLPAKQIELDSFCIFGRCVSAAQVGGDYFDYRALGESQLLFFIGDVAGHGVASAIMGAMVKGVFEYSDFSTGTKAGMIDLNHVLLGDFKKKKMMTGVLGILNTKSGELEIANAGHVNPLLIRNGKGEYIESSGKPLGISKRFTPTMISLVLEPGDLLLIMTDGLPEAVNRDGNQIGYKYIKDEIPGFLGESLLETDQNIRDWHKSICLSAIPEDDLSMLYISHKKQGAFRGKCS